LQGDLGRMPYDDEVSQELGVSMGEFEQLLSDVTPTTIISLEEAMPSAADSDSKTLHIVDTIEDPEGSNPLKDLGYQEVKRILKESIMELPEKEKLVVALYHYEELALKEIGEVLAGIKGKAAKANLVGKKLAEKAKEGALIYKLE